MRKVGTYGSHKRKKCREELEGESETEKTLGRRSYRWEKNIKEDLKKYWRGNLKQRGHLEDVVIDGRKILKKI